MKAVAIQYAGISRISVPSAKIGFLPRVFGRAYLAVENTFCNLARQFVVGYSGGELEFGYAYINTQLRVGTIYFAGTDDVEVLNPMGGSGGKLSPELAGIVFTTFTLCAILEAVSDDRIKMPGEMFNTLVTHRLNLLEVGRAIAYETGYSEEFFDLTD